MLAIDGLEVGYSGFQVLWGVDVRVHAGRVVALLGPNGAGKSTILNAVSGFAPRTAGSISFCGERIDRLPTHRIVARGLVHVLERRRVFPYLSVHDNLLLGAWLPGAKRRRAATLENVYDLFPRLRERARQRAHSLSGGEQQMLAIGRGLMAQPKLLMLDEPFLGLAPDMVEHIAEIIVRLRSGGVTILFIEQNVELALSLADYAYVLESGRVAVEGASSALSEHDEIRKVYLGL
jgi:branched-chain amino acid transport system ATP-binding protein